MQGQEFASLLNGQSKCVVVGDVSTLNGIILLVTLFFAQHRGLNNQTKASRASHGTVILRNAKEQYWYFMLLN